MESFEAALGQFPGVVGVAAKRLESGRELHHNADTLFFTASTFKVPLLAELYRQVEEASISLQERVELAEEQKLPGSGVLKEMAPGLQLTFQDLAMLMIIVSDNTATDIIYNRVGRDNLHKMLRSLGLVKTQIPMSCKDLIYNTVGMDPRDASIHWEEVQERLRKGDRVLDAEGFREETANVSTPAEMCHLLEMIQRRQVVSSAACDGMLDILKRQQHAEMLPRQLPPGTIVAHKTGGDYGILCDVGIVFAPNGPYVVAIMAKQATDPVKVLPAIAALSRAIYDQFVNGA